MGSSPCDRPTFSSYSEAARKRWADPVYRARTCAAFSRAGLKRRGRKRPPFSKEWCQNLSAAARGKKRGPCTKERSQNISFALKGRKLTKECRERISRALKDRGPFTKEHRESLSRAQMGRKHTEREKENMRRRRAKQVFPLRDTKIEVLTRSHLHFLGVSFRKHAEIVGMRRLGIFHQFDVMLPARRMVIEVDGCYWHGCRKHIKKQNGMHKRNRARDRKIDRAACSLGWKVIRLWEHEIKVGDFSKLRIALSPA